ncbi:MAG: hypothetical protein K0S78_2613 [Thermomicrobiales bacterium]|nr:hypothetical protein [Thermomicrobiales bacterium]
MPPKWPRRSTRRSTPSWCASSAYRDTRSWPWGLSRPAGCASSTNPRCEIWVSRARPSTRSRPASGANWPGASGSTGARGRLWMSRGKRSSSWMTGWRRGRRCGRGPWRCASSTRPGWSEPCLSPRAASAARCATWSTRWSAPRPRSRFTPSVSGTTTSGRPATTRCGPLLPVPSAACSPPLSSRPRRNRLLSRGRGWRLGTRSLTSRASGHHSPPHRGARVQRRRRRGRLARCQPCQPIRPRRER